MKPRDPMKRMADPIGYDPSDEESPHHDPGANGDGAPKPPGIPARGINTFVIPPEDDPSVLLGNRYLCRGDGLVLASSSGMGKSSITIQAAVTWCFGKPFMGIRPNGCLRSIIHQAEDSEGDMAEIWESVCYMMKLTPEEREIANERVVIVTDRVNRGLLFVEEVRRHAVAGKRDLVWINPMSAFITGDATTQQDMADFLRGGLNRINTPGSFGYIVIQHTPKPNVGKGRADERKWYEVMYDMAGSYDLIGWARSIISLRPTNTVGEFTLILAKRGTRAGVTKKVPQGTGWRMENTISIPIKHASGKMPVSGSTREIPIIFWEPREDIASEELPAKSNGRPKKTAVADFIGIFPVGSKNAKGVNELLREALKIRVIGKSSMYTLIDDALLAKLIVCDSSNPKSPLYFVPVPLSERSELDI